MFISCKYTQTTSLWQSYARVVYWTIQFTKLLDSDIYQVGSNWTISKLQQKKHRYEF